MQLKEVLQFNMNKTYNLHWKDSPLMETLNEVLKLKSKNTLKIISKFHFTGCN